MIPGEVGEESVNKVGGAVRRIVHSYLLILYLNHKLKKMTIFIIITAVAGLLVGGCRGYILYGIFMVF